MQPEAAPGTPSWLAHVNDRAALKLALEHRVITRNLVHQTTGLSKPTSSQMIARLIAANLIREVGPVPGHRGPNPIGYAPNLEAQLGVAMEIKEVSISATLVDVLGDPHPVVQIKRNRDITEQQAEQTAVAEVAEALAEATRAAGSNPEDVRQLLLSVPASVSPYSDQLAFAGSVSPWPLDGLATLLSSHLGKCVTFDRDAYLAAAAEMGHRPDCSDLALFWIGWGLGLTTVTDGQIVRGAAGRAGEVGYWVPNPESSPKDMQALLGPAGLIPLMQQIGYEGSDFAEAVAYLADTCSDERQPSDAEKEVLETITKRIVELVAPTLFLTDPDLLVLGGETGAAGGARLAAMVQEEVVAQTGWQLPVESTVMSDDLPLTGAREKLRGMLIEAMLDSIAE